MGEARRPGNVGRLVLQDIAKRFGGHLACSGVNLQIEQGEFFTLLGPSGCGKTTILRMIAGFLQPDEGSIYLGRRRLNTVAPEQRGVGMVFQNYALFPFLDVAGNVEYGLKQQHLSRKERLERVARYLELVGLGGFGARRIDELSGGEQQRVALARSLAPQPAILLLDEPLSNLDARLRERMRGELKALQQELGITTVFVTHDQSEALTMSDRIALFNRGRCVQVGVPEQIYSEPANVFVAGFLGEANLFPATVRNGMVCVDAQPELWLQPRWGELPVEGEKGTLFIRPQDITLLLPGALEDQNATVGENGAQQHVQGEVIQRTFCGITNDYLVRVMGCDFRVSRVNASGPEHTGSPAAFTPQRGDTVTLSIPGHRLRFLAD